MYTEHKTNVSCLLFEVPLYKYVRRVHRCIIVYCTSSKPTCSAMYVSCYYKSCDSYISPSLSVVNISVFPLSVVGVLICIGQLAILKDVIISGTIKLAHVFMKQTQEDTVSRTVPTVHLRMGLMTSDLQYTMCESYRVWGVWRMKRGGWCLR